MPGLDALIPRSQYSLRSGSPVYGPDGQIGTVAPIEAVLGKAGANGLYFNGVANDGAMADSAAQAIGTSDFFIFITVGPSDWTPSATECLFSKISGNNGVKLNLTTAGLLQLQIGNGTNFTTYSYSSTTAVPTADNHTAWVGVTVDRDGVATFYWNGSRLGDTVDVSGSAAQSATAAATAYLMRDGSNYHQGRVYGFNLGNYCPDAATVLRYYMYGVPGSDKWASFAPLYSSDFSAGVNGWTAQRSTITGNIDGIGGQDDTLRINTDATSGTHGAYYTLTAGKRWYASASLYVASANATAVKAALSIGGLLSSVASATDTWTTVSSTFLPSAASTVFLIAGLLSDGTTTSFAGTTGDLIYAKSVTITQLGCVVCLDGSVQSSVRSATWYDQSTNAINATVSGATVLLTRRSAPSTIDTWDSSGNPSAQVFEAGSWTPALSFDTPGDLAVTYTTRVGRYWRTGSLVVAVCDIVTSAFTHTTASGDFRINGLPYAAGAVASYAYPCGNVMDFTAMTQPGVDLVTYPTASTYIRIASRLANGTRTVISVTEVTTGVNRTIRVTLAYQV